MIKLQARKEDKCIRGFLGERNSSEDLGVYGALQIENMRMQFTLISLMTRTSSGLIYIRQRTSGLL